MKEKDEDGYKADYGERCGEEGEFLLVMDKDEGGYKADYGERVGQRCFCSLW